MTLLRRQVLVGGELKPVGEGGCAMGVQGTTTTFARAALTSALAPGAALQHLNLCELLWGSLSKAKGRSMTIGSGGATLAGGQARR